MRNSHTNPRTRQNRPSRRADASSTSRTAPRPEPRAMIARGIAGPGIPSDAEPRRVWEPSRQASQRHSASCCDATDSPLASRRGTGGTGRLSVRAISDLERGVRRFPISGYPRAPCPRVRPEGARTRHTGDLGATPPGAPRKGLQAPVLDGAGVQAKKSARSTHQINWSRTGDGRDPSRACADSPADVDRTRGSRQNAAGNAGSRGGDGEFTRTACGLWS
jgi:hypothetical protein